MFAKTMTLKVEAPATKFELWAMACGAVRKVSTYESLFEARVAAQVKGRPEGGSWLVRELTLDGGSLVRKYAV